MKKRGVLLAVAICFMLGCSMSSATQVQINIDKDGKCIVDNKPFPIGTLNTELTAKRHRAMGECSIRVACASNLTSSVLFQVLDQATMSGIFNVTLQVEGNTDAVNCSRPTPEQLPQSKDDSDSVKHVAQQACCPEVRESKFLVALGVEYGGKHAIRLFK